MTPPGDPRTYFAAERTLLAWTRTGIAVIGMGFVVARFGLFLRMVRTGGPTSSSSGSTAIGVGLVLLGSAALLLASWQHVRFCRTLAPADRPDAYGIHWSVGFAGMLAAIGVVLAAYLLIRSSALDL